MAYLAGYFDGEGCVCTPLINGEQITLTVTINSADRAVLLRLAKRLGGRVLRQVKPKGCARKRRIYRWCLGGSKAQGCLRKLLPYLVVKHKVAMLALKMNFNLRVGRKVLSNTERSNRVRLRRAICAINNRVTELQC